MNRRELFKGACAAFAAAGISIPASIIGAESYGEAPSDQATQYLQRLQRELMDKITNPPVILDGHRIRQMPMDTTIEALRYVNLLLEDPNAPTQKV